MIPNELKDKPWTPERALATLEAYLAGGDELGEVSEIEAEAAINTLRVVVDFVTNAQKILPQVQAEQALVQEKLAMRREQIDAMTAERDTLKADKELMDQAMDNLPGNIKRLVLTEYGRLVHQRQAPQIR